MDAQNYVETTGEDVESAIAAGLEELGVGPNDVLVEVLEEPSRGVFGIGAKPARVRLKLLRPPQPPPQPAPTGAVDEEEDFAEDEYDEYDEDDEDYYEDTFEEGEVAPAEDGEIAKEVLEGLLEKMKVSADINVRPAQPSRPGEIAPWVLEVSGQNMSLLIGRRGETLSSLQYIVRLMTSRRLQRRANIVVDAGGYKSRRSKKLRQLANRMADQAVQQRRTVSLEPMPPHERRVIHLTLRKRDDVETESTGEGSDRKVSIIPKI